MSGGARSQPGPLPPSLVDAHVHLYSMYDRERFLRAAWTNFERAREQLGLAEADYVLCFTEDACHDVFRELATSGRAGSIEICATEEEEALSVPLGARRLHLIAGRQILTAEGLELLALATRTRIPDGVSLADGLARARAAGAVPVVPWAFGKWWGKRGAVLHAALAEEDPPDLGDNSARPSLLADPEAFRRARARGRAVLPGTDPLPLRGHEVRAGSYGFVLESGLSSTHPARDLVAALRALPGPPRRFGRRVGPVEFVRDQVALRLRKDRAT